MVHCRQCKGFVDILRAAGFAEDRPTNGAAPPTTTYTYCDPSGAEYHRVYRQGDGPDKKVWQERINEVVEEAHKLGIEAKVPTDLPATVERCMKEAPATTWDAIVREITEGDAGDGQ